MKRILALAILIGTTNALAQDARGPSREDGAAQAMRERACGAVAVQRNNVLNAFAELEARYSLLLEEVEKLRAEAAKATQPGGR